MLVALAATAALAHSAKPVNHIRGCRTRACDQRVGRAWWRRHHPYPLRGAPTALASWYAPGGGFACDGAGAYVAGSWGVANKTLPCGTEVELAYGRAKVTAPVVDRGPFVEGRTFDLTAAVKSALGCGDLCAVRYRIK